MKRNRFIKRNTICLQDQFHDNSSDSIQIVNEKGLESQQKLKLIKKMRRENKPFQAKSSIPLDPNPKKFRTQMKARISVMIDLEEGNDKVDEEEINYYKEKMGLIEKDQEIIDQQKTEKAEEVPYIPPPIIKPVPKSIHEYPPYVLGHNDTWPPKYPHSMREFKREMREQRRLK